MGWTGAARPKLVSFFIALVSLSLLIAPSKTVSFDVKILSVVKIRARNGLGERYVAKSLRRGSTTIYQIRACLRLCRGIPHTKFKPRGLKIRRGLRVNVESEPAKRGNVWQAVRISNIRSTIHHNSPIPSPQRPSSPTHTATPRATVKKTPAKPMPSLTPAAVTITPTPILPTRTPTRTATPTATLSATPTATQTATPTRTRTPSPTATPAALVRVMPLGDSQTDGFNVPGAYRTSLWQELISYGVTVDFVGSAQNGPAQLGDKDHEGHSNYTIAMIDANLWNWLQAEPDVVLLLIGGNDALQGGDAFRDVRSRFVDLLHHIQSRLPAAHIIVSTFPASTFADVNFRIDQLNSYIRAVVAEEQNAGRAVSLVDIHCMIKASDLSSDGVHPTAAGYAKMGPVWLQGLKPVLGF